MKSKLSKINLSRFEKLYDSFDKGHNRGHLNRMRKVAISLAKKYCPDKKDLVYIAATLHDIGISVNRESHEINSAQMVEKDEELNRFLNKKELKEIIHAVREHRATTGNPRTVLAKVISDADRTSDTTAQALRRAYEHGKKYFPVLSDDEQVLRAARHLVKKYGPGGHGRRVYFKESESRLKKKIDPIIKLTALNNVEKLRKLMA